MKQHDRLDTLDRRPVTGRSLLLLGLWLRAAIVGVAFAAAGFAALIESAQGVPVLTALTWIAAGGTFAWLAWQRTVALIDRVDAVEPTKADKAEKVERDLASPIRPVAHLPTSS